MTDAAPTEQRGMYRAPFTLERPEKASQTLLSRVEVCPYSAALYIKHRGGAGSPASARGTAFHAFAEQVVNMLIGSGERSLPPEVAKDLMQAVLEERVDLVMPESERDACRVMAWNFALATVIEPETVIGVEQKLRAQMGDWTIRGQLDLLLRINRSTAIVRDYKTSLRIESKDEYLNSFQAGMYALLTFEGTPDDSDEVLGTGLSEVLTEQVYPRFRKEEDGRLVQREDLYDRARIHDFKRSVRGLLNKLEHGLETQEWAAQTGSHCRYCPARSECPIPEESRDIPLAIATEGQAAEVAQRRALIDDERNELTDALKAWVDENGDLVVGDERWTFQLERRETGNKDKIKTALSSSGLDPKSFYKESTSTRFKKVRA